MQNRKILVVVFIFAATLLINGCGNKKTTSTENNTPVTETPTIQDNTPSITANTAQEVSTTASQEATKIKPSESTQTQAETTKEPTKTTSQTTNTQTQTTQPTKTESTETPKPQPKPMQISSPAFTSGGNIPAEYTCSGSDVNPQLNIANVPDTAKSIALIMDDPDAPNGTWVHWVVFNIDPKTTVISKNSAPSGTQGTNSWGNASYGGPCPPSGTHRYYFKLYALDATLSLGSSATKASVEAAMQGHILSQTSLMGKYAK